MSLNLPQPVASYFQADSGHGEVLCQCFTEDAIVVDEGHTYRGRAAIKQWKEDAASKYQYTNEPIACAKQGGKTVVTSRLKGNFPGSPLNLRFFFEHDADKIASLEIVP